MMAGKSARPTRNRAPKRGTLDTPNAHTPLEPLDSALRATPDRKASARASGW